MWLDDETSVESSSPREGIEIRHGMVVHRIATGSRDVVIDGNRYVAQAAARGSVFVAFAGETDELSLELPVSHAFCQRWIGQQSPPRNVSVIIRRLQQNSGEAEIIWRGVLSTCEAQGSVATFQGMASTAHVIQRALPTLTISRSCQHILFDSNCRVLRTDWRVSTTVASYSGRVVTVASMGVASQWAQYGDLLHLSSGERMTIADQTGNVLTIQMPIPELRDGDAVHVFAGCPHDIERCRTKFNNVPNFSGGPSTPKDNPMLPGRRIGVVVV
jgi:hypothetical protein